MANKKDDRHWISARYNDTSLDYLNIKSAIEILQKALEAQERGEWEQLHLDYQYADSWDNKERLFIVGRRPETEQEAMKRIDKEKQIADWERKQFEALKAKFEPENNND